MAYGFIQPASFKVEFIKKLFHVYSEQSLPTLPENLRSEVQILNPDLLVTDCRFIQFAHDDIKLNDFLEEKGLSSKSPNEPWQIEGVAFSLSNFRNFKCCRSPNAFFVDFKVSSDSEYFWSTSRYDDYRDRNKPSSAFPTLRNSLHSTLLSLEPRKPSLSTGDQMISYPPVKPIGQRDSNKEWFTKLMATNDRKDYLKRDSKTENAQIQMVSKVEANSEEDEKAIYIESQSSSRSKIAVEPKSEPKRKLDIEFEKKEEEPLKSSSSSKDKVIVPVIEPERSATLLDEEQRDLKPDAEISGDSVVEEELAVKGILNMGNTCYINSVIQCVVRFPAVIGWFRRTYKYSTNC